MTNKNELNDEELEKVAGGFRTGNVYQQTDACGDFKCKDCGKGKNEHSAKRDARNNRSFIYCGNICNWNWEGTKLDCNHCQYYDDSYHICHLAD